MNPLNRRGIVRLEEAHRALERRLAGPEDDDPHAAADQLGSGLQEDVVSLLRREAADGADDHRRVRRLEVREAAELGAAVELAPEVLEAVVRGEVRVGLGVPLLPVDAVQDAGEPGGLEPEDAVEAGAPLGRADLPRVGGRDRRHHVGRDDRPLQHVDGAAVLDEAAGPGLRREAEDGELLGAVDPLVADVVDRQDRGDVVEPGVAPGAPGAEHRGEAGVPVVRVEHLRPFAHSLHRLDGGPHEEAEAPDAVVGAVLVLRVEAAGAVEEGVVGDEVDGDRGPGKRRAEDGDAVGGPQDRDVEGLDLLLGPGPAPAEPLGGLEEERDPDVDVVAGRGEGLRKGRSDVAEAARLGEGRDLGRKVRNAHQLSISPAVSAGFPEDGSVADDSARVSESVTRVSLRHESRSSWRGRSRSASRSAVAARTPHIEIRSRRRTRSKSSTGSPPRSASRARSSFSRFFSRGR